MQFSTMAGTAVGMAVGAAAVCLATQDQRMMRKTVHKLAKGAEKTLSDLRTGRKNYGNKGICTLLHSATRTNVHLTL